MRKSLFLCAIIALPLANAACGGDDSSTSTTSTTSTSAGAGGDSSTSSGNGGSFTPSPGADQIVINEINAIGTSEWVEIANKYDKDVELGGYAVADSAKGMAGADLAHAVRFPAGSKIEAGGYLILVRSMIKEDPPVKHSGSDCLSNAPASAACYYTSWEISNSNGEFIYFLAPDDQLLANAEYPALAVDPAAGGATWARLPDMTGSFAVSKTATPGGPNMP